MTVCKHCSYASLRQCLHSVSFVETIPVLSHRVSDIGTALGRAGMRLESLEVNTHQLDTRITLAESLKERVDRLHRLCDCSGTAITL